MKTVTLLPLLAASWLFPAFGTERTVDLVDLAQMDAALTLGTEFPGAKGGLAVAEADGTPVLRLSVDLERGAYVGMNFREQIPEGSSRIRFAYRVTSSAETCSVIFRFRDREGQYHLQRRSVTERGAWVESEFDLFAPANHWGDKVDDGVVRLPTEECTFAVELRGRSGRSGTLDLRGVRLVTTAGYDKLAPFVLKASSPRFGALYRPDETAEVAYRVFRRDGDVAVDGLRLRVEDWRGQELFRRAIPAGNGRERISADELGGRFGAFRAELSLPGQPAVKPGETWFARLTAKDDPAPCRWVGVGIHATHGWGGGDFRFLDLLTAAGIGLCRDEVSWGAVEHKRGVYAMPENFERLVDGLHRRGIRFNNLLNSKNTLYANPLDPNAFAKYCAWHVRHLGERCDLYEIWNEPHNFSFYQVYRDVCGYGRKPDGSLKDERGNVNLPWIPRFVELSRKAVGAIRAANPKADVAVCAEDSFPLLKKMLELGIATSNEVVTIHNYDHRNHPPEGDWFNRTDGRELREFASAHGGAMRFATTEDGWTTYRGGPNGEYAFVGNYPPCTPEQQARYLVRMYVTGRQNGLEYISQYDFKDDGPRRNYTEHNFGIVHEDYTPKPSFAAIAHMTRRIGASRPEGDVGPDHATCRIYRFRDPDGRCTYVCWAIAGEVKVPLPAEMAGAGEMADLQGNVRPFAPTSEITLDENPVYLRYADPEDFAARLDASFGIGSDRSLIGGNDLGLVNGHVTFNGRIEDVARVAGVYAPPFVCADFSLSVRFDGRPVAAAGHFWRPEVLERTGETNAWKITSRLFPLHGKRGGLLRIEVENAAKAVRDLMVRLESGGTAGRCERWGFNKPVPTAGTFADGTAAKSVGWTLGDGDEGILKSVAPGERRTFSVAFAVGAPDEADGLVRTALAAPQQAADESVAAWRTRVRKLADRMPRFETDDIALQRLYFRSLLHLLLAEWNVDAFVVKPYYATGGMNGGCICNYLWNFGGPFRLWPLLDRETLKAHLRAFLNLDLESCYAFAPTDGAPLGPYYPINQEKIVFLIDAYVRETGDRAFLAERHKGRTMAEWAVRMSLTHDDLSQSAVLVDYGEGGKNHLELRKSYRYDGVMPDLNLRRIALLHIADRLCRIAGYDPKVDLAGRAAALRSLVREKLWDDEAGWFRAICSDGKPTFRYTMQMFKALGWGETVLDRDVEERLVKRLMDPKEFLGAYGVHSLSKLDPAYDENDVDNGGPGACPSFAPAICERLYRDGRFHEANDILMRLRWLGDSLPYWGDSHYADRRDYRRDTPLQCDIEGACLAQAIVFGLFGISIDDDFKVTFNPHLPDGVNRLSLKNLRLAGKTFDVRCSRKDGAAVDVRTDIDR